MKEAFGNIWDLASAYDAMVITTNGYVKKNGEAVMGRGVALEAKERDPKLALSLGNMLTKYGNNVFGFRNEKSTQRPYWIFTMPVKPAYGPNGEPGWRVKADLDLIRESAKQLAGMEPYYGILRNIKDSADSTHPEVNSIILPRPGCGNGGLKWEDVKPVIEPILDDRFTVVTWNP